MVLGLLQRLNQYIMIFYVQFKLKKDCYEGFIFRMVAPLPILLQSAEPFFVNYTVLPKSV